MIKTILGFNTLPKVYSRAATGPMTVGEVRKFIIDKTKKKSCGLEGENTVEIEIKKEKSEVYVSTFRMVKPNEQAFVHCDYGYVPLLKTMGKAQKCGIGRILMELCNNEEEIHDVAGNEKNEAVNQIDKYIQDSSKKESNEEHDQEVKKLKSFKEWTTEHCSKLIYLLMEAKPRSTAHVYFNSAMASGFTRAFMISHVWLWYEDVKFYPDKGPCKVKKLQKRYSDDGYMIDGDKKTLVWGWNWFFCYLKKETKLPDCNIL